MVNCQGKFKLTFYTSLNRLLRFGDEVDFNYSYKAGCLCSLKKAVRVLVICKNDFDHLLIEDSISSGQTKAKIS